MLSFKDVHPFSSDYRAVKDLQRHAFPKSEQLPLFALWVLTLLGRAAMCDPNEKKSCNAMRCKKWKGV